MRTDMVRAAFEATAFALILAVSRWLPDSLEVFKVDWWQVGLGFATYVVVRAASLALAKRSRRNNLDTSR